MQCPECQAYSGNTHETWCPGRRKEEEVKNFGKVQAYRCPTCQAYKGNVHESWCQYRK